MLLYAFQEMLAAAAEGFAGGVRRTHDSLDTTSLHTHDYPSVWLLTQVVKAVNRAISCCLRLAQGGGVLMVSHSIPVTAHRWNVPEHASRVLC